jgi:hypothetical protein
MQENMFKLKALIEQSEKSSCLAESATVYSGKTN